MMCKLSLHAADGQSHRSAEFDFAAGRNGLENHGARNQVRLGAVLNPSDLQPSLPKQFFCGLDVFSGEIGNDEAGRHDSPADREVDDRFGFDLRVFGDALIANHSPRVVFIE